MLTPRTTYTHTRSSPSSLSTRAAAACGSCRNSTPRCVYATVARSLAHEQQQTGFSALSILWGCSSPLTRFQLRVGTMPRHHIARCAALGRGTSSHRGATARPARTSLAARAPTLRSALRALGSTWATPAGVRSARISTPPTSFWNLCLQRLRASSRSSTSISVLKRNQELFVLFPCVCPEPALVNHDGLRHGKTQKRSRFLRRR